MLQENFNLAWNLLVELRKEVMELQKVRTQIVGFKITFVSAAIAAIAANLDKIPIQLMAIPAFAAIFFDLVIANTSNSIKRLGTYCFLCVEPALKDFPSNWPYKSPLWEEFLKNYVEKKKQWLAKSGEIGITGLAVAAATFALIFQFIWYYSLPLLFLLIVFFAFDIFQMWKSGKPLKVSEDVEQ